MEENGGCRRRGVPWTGAVKVSAKPKFFIVSEERIGKREKRTRTRDFDIGTVG